MNTAAPLSLAVLLVCRNRRETTLEALRALSSAAAESGVIARAVLFDDASTDGTVEAVLREFPETIMVRGTGDAFWNGGLYQAWSRALEFEVDGYLWLNDDVLLDPDALPRLRDGWKHMEATHSDRLFILVGSTRDCNGGLTYGGYRLKRSPFALRFRKVEPVDDLAPIDTFNGNIVLIPSQVVEAIGINDPAYHHNLGDIDYGLRAVQARVDVRLLEGTLGICETNEAKRMRGFGSPHLSVREQWRKVNTHHGLPIASWWRFTRRFSGWWFPLHFLLPYRKLFIFRRYRKEH